MAVTESINQSDGVVRFATGTYLEGATAAAHDVNCGFKPRYVKVWNEATGDQLEWNDKMADAEGFKRVAAGTAAMVTSLGITPIADGVERGFTIGLDTDINVVNEQVSWIAIG